MPLHLSYPRSPYTRRIHGLRIFQPWINIVLKPLNLDFGVSVLSIHLAFSAELKEAHADKKGACIRKLQRDTGPT
jgi:hypothetical protein